MIGAVYSGQHRIPIRNIWLLVLYASELFRHLDGSRRAGVEENPDDIPDLIAEILAYETERRLVRNLNAGWRVRQADLTRVRGRIDLLRTETRQLLPRGKVACRFNELTIDTPRNRLVRAALTRLAAIAGRPELAARCRTLAARLERLGVAAEKPHRTETAADTFSHFDANDRLMVAAAKLAFDLALPNEQPGATALTSPERNIDWLRGLFEKAVAGFYQVVISPDGWRVHHRKSIHWQQSQATPGIANILPSMETDIELEHRGIGRRIVIDTKFTGIIVPGYRRKETIRNDHIYQIYSYLRSQENESNPLSINATGIILYPAAGERIDEAVIIQGHPVRFATVDLAAAAPEIRRQLLAMTEPHPSHARR